MNEQIVWIAAGLTVLFFALAFLPWPFPPEKRLGRWQSWMIGCVTIAAAMGTLVANGILNERDRAQFEAHQLSTLLARMETIEKRLDGARILLACAPDCIAKARNGLPTVLENLNQLADEIDDAATQTDLEAMGLWHIAVDLHRLSALLRAASKHQSEKNRYPDFVYPHPDTPENEERNREAYYAYATEYHGPKDGFAKLQGGGGRHGPYTSLDLTHRVDKIISTMIFTSILRRDRALATAHPKFNEMCLRAHFLSDAFYVSEPLRAHELTGDTAGVPPVNSMMVASPQIAELLYVIATEPEARQQYTDVRKQIDEHAVLIQHRETCTDERATRFRRFASTLEAGWVAISARPMRERRWLYSRDRHIWAAAFWRIMHAIDADLKTALAGVTGPPHGFKVYDDYATTHLSLLVPDIYQALKPMNDAELLALAQKDTPLPDEIATLIHQQARRAEQHFRKDSWPKNVHLRYLTNWVDHYQQQNRNTQPKQ